ncbi:hypothetical protein, partial [Pseudomonas aeruginosa]|uniref:hypothetical protein n=1 Tax=Pseudomonas aeruginosa TaxID=287 RepID=UPI002B40B459
RYQAVARGNNGALLVNTSVNLRFSIRTGSATGAVEYQETQTTSTNQFGLFSVEVGSGTPTTGVFSNINWAATAPKYIQTEIDLGSGFLDLG